MDTSKMYLFHNVYGDAEDLIKTAPYNVICVPFGWDEETESNRNRILSELNVGISVIPSLVVYGTKISYDIRNNPISTAPHWYPINFDHESKPWSWEQIGFVSQEPRTELVVEVVEHVVEAVEAVVEEVVEPVVEVLVEPVVEVLVEPVVEVIEPVVEAVVEVIEPVVEVLVEPVAEVIEPVVEAVVEVIEPVVEAVVEPVVETVVEPVVTEPEAVVEPVVEETV